MVCRVEGEAWLSSGAWPSGYPQPVDTGKMPDSCKIQPRTPRRAPCCHWVTAEVCRRGPQLAREQRGTGSQAHEPVQG